MKIPIARVGTRSGVLRDHPRLSKTLWWIAGIVLFIAVAGFLVAPPIVKWQAQKRLSALLHRPVTIESVSINPFALSTKVEGFRVGGRDGDATALSFAKFYARLSYQTLVRFAPVVAEAKLERPYVHLVRKSDREYDFQDLVDEFSARPEPKTPEPKEPARFSLNNLQLFDGKIEFDDRAKQRKHEVTAINVSIPFVSNFDANVKVFVQPKLEAVVNGDPLRVTGETKPFDESLETKVSFNLQDVDLPPYLQYSPVPLAFTLPSGKLDAAVTVSFSQAGAKRFRLVVSGHAAVRDLAAADAAGEQVLAFRQLDVVVDSLDVFGRKVDISRIGLQSPVVDLRREKDGSLNLVKLAPEMPQGSSKDTRSEPPFAFEVGEIAITDGKMTLADLGPERPFRRRLENLELRVRGLANAENKRAGVELGFDSIPAGDGAASSAPARVDYTGDVQLTPVKVAGKLQVLKLKLGDLFPYYEAAINAEVLDGTADVSAAFDLALENNAPTGRVTDMAATISGVHLRLPGSRAPFVVVPSASLKGGEADLAARRVALSEIVVDKPAYAIERLADGTLNAAQLLKPVPSAAAPSSAAQPWVVTLRRLKLEHGSATLEDQMVKPRVKVALGDMTLTGEDLSTVEDAQAKFDFRSVVNRTGSVSLKGAMSPQLSGTVAITASKIGLAPFNPYLAQYSTVSLASGNVSTRGALTVTGGKTVRAAFKGKLDIADLALRKGKEGDDLLKWQSLSFGGIDAVSEPLRVSIAEVGLADLFARLVLDATGQLNLREVAKETPVGAPTASKPPAIAEAKASAGAKPQDVGQAGAATGQPIDWLRVGAVRVQNGHVDFSDFFVKPNYRADLTELNGRISTLTFEEPADLEFTGKVNQAGTLEVRGKVNPLAANIFLDMEASARDIELPRLSPYSAKYLGYGIDRGKLSVKVKYLLEDRKLTAANSIYLDQLKLGEKVVSADAADLPVPLAISLLQDRDGVIDVNLPIEGSLDDPQFDISGIVLQVIGNIIMKAVTAPFALLGSVAGGGGDLDYLEFAPGSAKLSEASEKKLDTLGKALTDRPGLKLDVIGRADPATDREGLKQGALDRAVKQVKFDELRGDGKAPQSVDDVSVDPKEYPALLKRAYGDADIPGKPRNFIGFAKDIPVPEMEKLILASTSASDDDLRDLAIRRAQAAKDYLTGPGKIPAERVFIVSPKISSEDAKAAVKPTRVEFALR
jgi:uncharacterized protein involved in outer membrane biogenesis